jgi:hypothetical protein
MTREVNGKYVFTQLEICLKYFVYLFEYHLFSCVANDF